MAGPGRNCWLLINRGDEQIFSCPIDYPSSTDNGKRIEAVPEVAVMLAPRMRDAIKEFGFSGRRSNSCPVHV